MAAGSFRFAPRRGASPSWTGSRAGDPIASGVIYESRPDRFTSKAATEGFVAFLKAQGLAAHDVDPGCGGDWSKLPTQFDPAAARLIGSIAEHVAFPVTCSQPLVEASLIESPAGSIIVLADWSGRPVRESLVTAHIPLPARNATLASGAKLTVGKDGQRTTFTFELDVADVLVLR